MPKLVPPRTRPPQAAPGKPTLAACPGCGCTVLVRIAEQREYRWQDPKSDTVAVRTILHWREVDPPRTPLGAVHDCTLARERWALIERWRAGGLEICEGTQGREWTDKVTREVIEVGQEVKA